MSCTWKEDKRDAMRVAADLGIPFHFLDLSKEYKKDVVDYMVSEYKKGRTPNPDVMCNASVKFGGFYDWVKKQDPQACVATGHYATVVRGGKDDVSIIKGVDTNKDQTYFLWQIKKEQISSIIFPLGHIPKEDTRRLAECFNVHTKHKKDSQGLCFIGHVDMGDFLGHFIDLKKGNVINSEGKVLGEHRGSEIYTIGQRGGFTLHNKTDNQKALYIVSKSVKENTITVSSDKKNDHSKSKTVILENCNWRHLIPRRCTAQVRYHGKILPCILKKQDTKMTEVEIDLMGESLVPGQSVVLYDEETCLGGGIIF